VLLAGGARRAGAPKGKTGIVAAAGGFGRLRPARRGEAGDGHGGDAGSTRGAGPGAAAAAQGGGGGGAGTRPGGRTRRQGGVHS
jgi:hypothetical protein